MSLMFSNNKDQLCVNLSHDIKVYCSMNDSVLIKNYRDGNCIAVAGGVGVNGTRLFSLEREGIKVHHNGSDCMGIEIIPISVSNNVTGTIATISKNNDKMLNHQFLSCEKVYQQEQLPMTQDVEDKAMMLVNTCFYEKKDDSVKFRFQNGLEIIQFSSGHTRIFMANCQSTIMMNSRGAVFISIGNSTIVSTRRHFNAIKGDVNFEVMNRNIVI